MAKRLFQLGSAASRIFLLAVMVPATPTMATGLNFLGLSGASNRADVRRLFPSATRFKSFNGGIYEVVPIGGLDADDQLFVSHYSFGGLDYGVTFRFGATWGELRSITLRRLFYGNGQQPRSIYLPREPNGPSLTGKEIKAIFKSEAALLSSQLGPPADPDPQSSALRGPGSLQLSWQPEHLTKYLPYGDKVLLWIKAQESNREPGRYTGTLWVAYKFPRPVFASEELCQLSLGGTLCASGKPNSGSVVVPRTPPEFLRYFSYYAR